MPHPFHIVDVFAEERFAGNPLAVVLHAQDLTTAEMQRIAREMNYSETTFVCSGSDADDGYRVRIFTPAQEIPFAGHPTLGTASVVRQHIASQPSDEIRLNLDVGQVRVTFEPRPDAEVAWLEAPPIELGRVCAPERIAPVLHLSPDDIARKAPVQHVSAGISFIFVPLRTLAALRCSRLDLDRFHPLAEESFPSVVYLFCEETVGPQNDLCVRLFFDADGVREDPATGSAAACLGAYLLAHRYLGTSELDLRLEQGAEIHRPSLLLLRARAGAKGRILVGGRVIPAARGEIL